MINEWANPRTNVIFSWVCLHDSKSRRTSIEMVAATRLEISFSLFFQCFDLPYTILSSICSLIDSSHAKIDTFAASLSTYLPFSKLPIFDSHAVICFLFLFRRTFSKLSSAIRSQERKKRRVGVSFLFLFHPNQAGSLKTHAEKSESLFSAISLHFYWFFVDKLWYFFDVRMRRWRWSHDEMKAKVEIEFDSEKP